MDRFKWSGLSPLQLGRYAEYLVKMEFAKFRHSVFSAEVDDRGIDFVIRTPRGVHHDVQVKSSSRLKSSGGFHYQFWRKEEGGKRPQIGKNFHIALVLLSSNEEPHLYLIPSTVWRKPSRLFVVHNYPGLKSPPEHGLNLSKKNLSLLKPFEFSERVKMLA